MKDYNELIFGLLKSKFNNEILYKISKDFSILDKSYILFKLKYLFELLSEEMGKLYEGIYLKNNYFMKRIIKLNLDVEYIVNTSLIFNDDHNIKLNNSNNKKIKKCINEIINFIESIPPWNDLYLDLDLSKNDLNLFVDENLITTIILHQDILENPNDYDEYQINNAIMFFELMKNNHINTHINTYINNNELLYNYYENLQEQYYQILNNKYEEETEELIFMFE